MIPRKKGLKTGMYYLRTQAALQAMKFIVENQAGKNMETLIPEDVTPLIDEIAEVPVCSMEEECASCSGKLSSLTKNYLTRELVQVTLLLTRETLNRTIRIRPDLYGISLYIHPITFYSEQVLPTSGYLERSIFKTISRYLKWKELNSCLRQG